MTITSSIVRGHRWYHVKHCLRSSLYCLPQSIFVGKSFAERQRQNTNTVFNFVNNVGAYYSDDNFTFKVVVMKESCLDNFILKHFFKIGNDN